jgi:hypothetical protein
MSLYMTTATAPDYLKLPVTWSPSRHFEHGQPYEYRLTLRGNDVATLTAVAGQGWALTITNSGRMVIERGLFATVCDALMVIYAEYYPQLVSAPPER